MVEGTVFGDPGWSITRYHFCWSRVVTRQHVPAAIGEVSKGLQEVSQRKDAKKESTYTLVILKIVCSTHKCKP